MIPIKPAGYKMLVKQVIQENVSAGGILLNTDEEAKRQQAGFPIYEVLAMGPACYRNRADGSEFPEGPWCNVGDTVVMDGYVGKTIKPKEFEGKYRDDPEALEALKEMERAGLSFHLVNDDNVQAIL
jgi:co-chaperonin GroES (HSP10)